MVHSYCTLLPLNDPILSPQFTHPVVWPWYASRPLGLRVVRLLRATAGSAPVPPAVAFSLTVPLKSVSHPCLRHSILLPYSIASQHLSVKNRPHFFASVDMFRVSLSSPKHEVRNGGTCILRSYCFTPSTWNSTWYMGGGGGGGEWGCVCKIFVE